MKNAYLEGVRETRARVLEIIDIEIAALHWWSSARIKTAGALDRYWAATLRILRLPESADLKLCLIHEHRSKPDRRRQNDAAHLPRRDHCSGAFLLGNLPKRKDKPKWK